MAAEGKQDGWVAEQRSTITFFATFCTASTTGGAQRGETSHDEVPGPDPRTACRREANNLSVVNLVAQRERCSRQRMTLQQGTDLQLHPKGPLDQTMIKMHGRRD